jgi:arylsulfatase A
MLKNLITAFLFFVLIIGCANTKKPPNIIYILADDLGYGDLSCLNKDSKIKTKHIDALADRGVYFTDAHSSSAVCTPTRYGILTGRYAWRSTLKKGVTWSYDNHLIDTKRLTVASYLRQKGYRTACIGKWHLGLDWARDESNNLLFKEPIKNGPNALGFDYFFGIAASLDIPPYFYIENDRITAASIDTIEARALPEFWRKGPVGDDFKHIEVLPKITEKAVDYISKNANQEHPFFLYFVLPAPHTPILPTNPFLGKSNTTVYGDFVLMVDDVVGQITRALAESRIDRNSIVIFTSDNGFAPYADHQTLEGLGHYPSYHFRGYKADIYEGGHRIPFIFSWPQEVEKGKHSDETICLTDFFATCAAIFNDPLPPNAGEDSYNILPVILNREYESPIREATVHHSVNGSFSIRKGEWKMIFCPGSGGWSHPTPEEAKDAGLPPVQLYNIKKDIAETTNVADEHPQVVSELTKLMTDYIEKGRSTPGIKLQNEGTTLLY